MKRKNTRGAVSKRAEAPVVLQPAQPAQINRLMLIVIAVFSLVLYAQTTYHQYTIDDGTVMQNNTIVKKGISAIPEIFSTRYRAGFWDRKENLYRPLSLAMFAVEWQLAPGNPMPGHLINILLYALTGIFLFRLMSRLLKNHHLLIPFFITLVFIAHPLHTEVTANIKSRDEILCFLFLILSMLGVMQYIRKTGVLNLVMALSFFFLGLLSKENAITFVAVVPLMLYFFSETPGRKILNVTLLFLVVASLYLGLRAAVLGSLSSQAELQLINNSLLGAPDHYARFATAVYIMGKYLYLLFVPHPLSFDYSYNQIQPVFMADIKAWGSLLIYLFLFVFSLRGIKSKNPVAFSILFYFITMSLVSNIFFLIESTMAERFLYLPSLGFSMALILLADKWLRKKNKNAEAGSLKKLLAQHAPLSVLVISILILFSSLTIARNADWKNNLTILAQDVKTAPNSARIRYAYGSAIFFEQALLEKDKEKRNTLTHKAIEQLEKGVAILNTYADAYFHLGLAYKEISDYSNAIRCFESARNMKQFDQVDFFLGSGISYGAAGRYREAVTDLKKAAELDPQSYDVFNNLGIYYTEMNIPDSALTALTKAHELNEKNPTAVYNTGNLFAKKSDYKTAIEYYSRAVVLDSVYEDALNNIGNCYAAMKEYSKALEFYERVYKLNPQNKKAVNNLGVTFAMLGDTASSNRYMRLLQNIP